MLATLFFLSGGETVVRARCEKKCARQHVRGFKKINQCVHNDQKIVIWG